MDLYNGLANNSLEWFCHVIWDFCCFFPSYLRHRLAGLLVQGLGKMGMGSWVAEWESLLDIMPGNEKMGLRLDYFWN